MSGRGSGWSRTEYLRFRAALRDPTTGLYGFTLFFDHVRALVSRDERVGVIWVGLGDRQFVEPVYGWEAYDALVREAAGELERAVGGVLPGGTLVSAAAVHADAFVVFVPSEVAGTPLAGARLAEMASELRARLRDGLQRRSGAPPALEVRPCVGATLLTDNPMQRFERRVLRAIDEARALAERPAQSDRIVWTAELERILSERRVRAVYQPIVELESGRRIGVEAFARGPERSVLRLPRVLFGVGREAGLVGRIDAVCREAALAGGATLPAPLLLFVNGATPALEPDAWPDRLPGGLDAGRVVIEVEEATLARDADRSARAVQRLRDAGFRFSIDDVGSSARSCELAERLRPDFLKVDLSVLRAPRTVPLVHELIRSLVQMSRRIGARLIVERIERDDEREMLIECGVRLGQGYLFGREGPLPAALRRGAARERPRCDR